MAARLRLIDPTKPAKQRGPEPQERRAALNALRRLYDHNLSSPVLNAAETMVSMLERHVGSDETKGQWAVEPQEQREAVDALKKLEGHDLPPHLIEVASAFRELLELQISRAA